jgi:hypothetical protein
MVPLTGVTAGTGFTCPAPTAIAGSALATPYNVNPG